MNMKNDFFNIIKNLVVLLLFCLLVNKSVYGNETKILINPYEFYENIFDEDNTIKNYHIKYFMVKNNYGNEALFFTVEFIYKPNLKLNNDIFEDSFKKNKKRYSIKFYDHLCIEFRYFIVEYDEDEDENEINLNREKYVFSKFLENGSFYKIKMTLSSEYENIDFFIHINEIYKNVFNACIPNNLNEYYIDAINNGKFKIDIFKFNSLSEVENTITIIGPNYE